MENKLNKEQEIKKVNQNKGINKLYTELEEKSTKRIKDFFEVKERILCPAIMIGGIKITGYSYKECLELSKIIFPENQNKFEFIEGFLTTSNRFVTKKEAYIIHNNIEEKELTIEDFYG